jgi:hypothetical protein
MIQVPNLILQNQNHHLKYSFSENFSITCAFLFFRNPSDQIDPYAAKPFHGISQIIYLLVGNEPNLSL